MIARTVASSYTFEGGQQSVIIPFEVEDSAVFLQTRVGESKQLWFEIDSGSATSYLDNEVARTLGLRIQGKKSVQGAGAGKVEVELYQEVEFNLLGLRSWNHTAHGISFTSISRRLGRPLHGLFGNDFVGRFTVTIDYHGREVRIEERSVFNYKGRGIQLPLEFQGGLPYVRATIHVQGNPPLEDLFVIDSGSSDEVNHPIIAKSTAGTESTTGGIGFGSPIAAQLGRVDLLELGPIKIRGTTGVATESSLGSWMIGGGVLSRFKVIFDYQQKRMIPEEPNSMPDSLTT